MAAYRKVAPENTPEQRRGTYSHGHACSIRLSNAVVSDSIFKIFTSLIMHAGTLGQLAHDQLIDLHSRHHVCDWMQAIEATDCRQ
jgi:hypothetical protein